MQGNEGFARGNNAGIRVTSGDTVLLLNPDVIILGDAIAHCYNRLLQSTAIAASVQLLNADHSPQITGNFFMKGGLNHLLPLPYLGPLLRRIAFAAKVKKTNVQVAATEEKVDWINGAFLMVKKSVLEKAGLLDEDFFLYAEEIEWCSRLGRQGDLVVYGDLHAIHLVGETIDKATGAAAKGYTDITGRKGLQLLVSGHLRIRKQFGTGWFLFHLLVHTAEIPFFLFCLLADNILHARNPFLQVHAVIAYAANIARLWGLASRIIANKPYFYKMF